jgi:DNA replication and repair protein RecF
MLLRTLYLKNFRCYEEASFDFCSGINTICGANAQGKTSLLEAIYFLSTGRSFRTSQASDLIRLDASSFNLQATFIKNDVEQSLKIFFDGKERKILYNSTICPSSTSLLGLLQGVVVTPDDVTLVKGSPLIRRHFLDLQMAQSDPLYVHHLTRYNRAMRQRNALLRAKNSATLESWEHEMANAAAYLTHQRTKTINSLQHNGKKMYMALSGEAEELGLGYKTSAPKEEGIDKLRQYYVELLRRLRPREIIYGCTLAGPQKDDLTISIGEKEARFFASEGQQRSCVAALRLAEWERLSALANEAPLMLIDDVGVSLDSTRRGRLLEHLQNLGQVFLTATQELPLPSMKKENYVLRL